MILQKLFDSIEKHEDELTKDLVKEFRKMEETRHYRDIPEDILYKYVQEVLYNVHTKLVNWLAKHTQKDVLFAYYKELGKERFEKGIPLQEVVMVLMIIKRKLWVHVNEHNLLDSGYGLNQLIEMSYFVNLFFDRIIHSTIVGYENEQLKLSKEKRV